MVNSEANMDVELLFKIAGVGILVAVVTQLLKQSGRDEMATIAAIVGLVIGLLMMLEMIGTLFDSVRQVFQLY
ncbi:MAG: stage III sporulation protein AC [Eubacteriales bacterium]|nr:stage III sporulation protein AC [Eubacteriales bacterium]